MSKLKQNIKRVLTERDVSLARLALLCGVPQSTLHRIMTGAICEPRSSTIAPLAAFLGVTVQTLRDGDLPISLTFNDTLVERSPAVSEPAQRSATNPNWDRESHLKSFAAYFADSVPKEYLEWCSVIEGGGYRLDYCSERLAVDLICYSRVAPASHSKVVQIDFSGLFAMAAGHLVDLFMVRTTYTNLTPLLLILCPEIPDETAPSTRKLLTSARRLGVHLRFATTGAAAIQIVLKAEGELLHALSEMDRK